MSLITISIIVLLSILLIVFLTSVTKLNAFASLFIVALLVALATLPGKGVVSRFSGIDSNTTLKVYSSATIVMGLVTFCCVWLLSLFLS